MRQLRCYSHALLLSLISTSPFAAERVTITTLEWPPYTGLSLPSAGATSEVVRRTFSQIGIDVDIVFLPWKRAIATADIDDNVAAYFPGYGCQHKDGFLSSDSIGTGPLGFAEHVDAPISWQSIDDLGEQKLKIGTVIGYANTKEFDEKAGTGWLRALPAKDDLTNLKKLARQRIDAVVIDKLVMSYLLVTEPSLQDYAQSVQFNVRPLEDKNLNVCFKEDDAGKALLQRFNAGLQKIDSDAIVSDYFKHAFQ